MNVTDDRQTTVKCVAIGKITCTKGIPPEKKKYLKQHCLDESQSCPEAVYNLLSDS